MANQAAWLDEQGKRFRVGEADEAKAGRNEVVVKNHALAINPVDWKVQDYGFAIEKYPAVLGSDVAGEITEVGSGLTKFKVGDRVIGHALRLVTGDNKNAAFQLYTVLPSERIAKIPDSMSFEDGVVLPLAVSTAADGLYNTRSDGYLGMPYPTLDGKPSNQVLIVYGGSSSVGALAIQLAVASGARVLSLASEKNFQFVRDAGAVEVFDYKKSNVVDEVVDAVKKLGGDFVGVYDAISQEDQSYPITLSILQKVGAGNLATVLPLPKNLPGGIKAGFVNSTNKSTDPVWNHFIEPALVVGKLRPIPPPLIIGRGLESIQAGLDKNKEGVSAKKVIVKL